MSTPPDHSFASCIPGGLIDLLVEPMPGLTEDQQLRASAVEEQVQRLISTLAASCPHSSRWTGRAVDLSVRVMDEALRAIRLEEKP